MRAGGPLLDGDLAPMQCYRDVTVTASQGQTLKLIHGGPIWPDWDNAILARHRRDGEVSDLRPQPGPVAHTLSGDYVWGGQLIPHFGHLISEQTMRLAQSAQDRPDDPALFILQKNIPEQGVPGFVWSVLDWLGYPRSKARIVKETTKVDRLWVAEQAEMLGEIPPTATYLDLLEKNSCAKGLRPLHCELVYVSRAQLNSPQEGRLLGESYLCAMLEALGAQVCYPETLSLADQMAVYAGARHLIFAEGSAMHGRQLLGRADQSISVLNRRPGWRTAEAALRARAASVDYHDVCPTILAPSSANGFLKLALGASIFDQQALIAAFESLGLPLGSVWDAKAFQTAVEADLRLWLSATFEASIILIDIEDSARRIDAQLQESGLKGLDYWVSAERRKVTLRGPKGGAFTMTARRIRACAPGQRLSLPFKPAAVGTNRLQQGEPMRKIVFCGLALTSALTLTACDPSETVDKAMRRTAETVVLPVVDDFLPGDQAQIATRCIVENATPDDLRLLVRDVAVEAGTSTVNNVLDIAVRPETQACLIREGLPALLGGLL